MSERRAPFSPTDLYSEVLRTISERADAGLLTGRGWLVSAVLVKHPIKRHLDTDPDDFSQCCRSLAVSAAVDKALARLKHQDEGGDDPDERELDLPRLPGFVHLRRVYPLKRKAEIFLVPLGQMSDGEIEDKANRYDAASTGYAEHAAELRRYKTARPRAA